MFQDQATKQSVKLGVFFCILFTSYLSFQNIVTHVYEQQGLSAVGPLNLIVNYLSFLISNTLAVKCKYSFKTQLFVGGLAYSVNMGTGIIVPYIESHFLIYIIVAAGGIIGGISAGFLWVSQGGYLRQVCKYKQNKGKYNAIFSTLLSLASLTAGLTTTFFLGYFSNQVYFIALTSMSIFSSFYCLFFLKDLSQSSSQKSISESKASNILSNQQNIQETSKNLQKSNQKTQSVIKDIILSLKYYKNMLFVLIFLIVDGLCLGIQSNQMIKLIPDEIKEGDPQQFRFKSGIVTIFLGLGSIVSSYIFGPISDGYGLKLAGKVTLFSYILTCILTFVASVQKMYFMACFMSFLWGFTYYLFEGWIYVTIFKVFKGRLQAFAINKQVHCISMAGFQVFVILTENKFDVKWLMVVVIWFFVPCLWCLLKVDYSNQIFGKGLLKKDTKSIQNQQSLLSKGSQQNISPI